MDESGTPPSDPSPTSGDSNREAAPEPAAPAPTASAAAEVRRARGQDWESRRYQSIEACESVEEKLREVEALSQGASGAEGFHRAEALLNEVRALLGSDAPDSPGRTLLGPDRRACWDRWRKVRDALKHVRAVQQEQDYQALAAPVVEVNEYARSGDAYEAVRRVKELQARLGKAYLRRGQFEVLRKRLSEAWQAAQARIGELRRERAARRNEWRARMEGHLARWRGAGRPPGGSRRAGARAAAGAGGAVAPHGGVHRRARRAHPRDVREARRPRPPDAGGRRPCHAAAGAADGTGGRGAARRLTGRAGRHSGSGLVARAGERCPRARPPVDVK